MRAPAQSKSKTVRGVTDLTLVAPIKRGLIPALDSRSYESRLRMLMATLHMSRVSSLEVRPTPLIEDAVDRIRTIQSFRLAIVGQEQRQLLLAVAFDGGWEPYMRRIWRDLGPLLDVIFCNCDGYLLAHDHSFPAYAGWVRSAQVATGFFYNASPLTVSDLHYLRRNEQRRVGGVVEAPTPDPDNYLEQALPAITALYRLTDMYPDLPGSKDGQCLRRAAHHLLPGALKQAKKAQQTCQPPSHPPSLMAALRWFAQSESVSFPSRPTVDPDFGNVQGGIVAPYPDLKHARLLLIGLHDAAAAKALLSHLRGRISTSGSHSSQPGRVFVNLAFTYRGLQIAGVPDGTLDQLPQEFREGMAARAAILGDRLHNHPSRWPLPQPYNAKRPCRVELSCVHAIVQLAVSGVESEPLDDWAHAFEESLQPARVQILAVEAMKRKDNDKSQALDHFGFVDGISQPDIGNANDPAGTFVLGDLLLGYRNGQGDPPMNGRLWKDGTFLVVRKLRQRVHELNQALSTASSEGAGSPEYLKALMMGRWPDGKSLIKLAQGPGGNDFTYDDDSAGQACPYQAHIRRANPRTGAGDLKFVPRILRRGMSYGPRCEEGESAEAERGLVFMAYCASIAEQYEVIQSWLSGGNSSGEQSYSGLRDPFLGVPHDGESSVFEFKDHNGHPRHLPLPVDPPLVSVEWGAYLFVPSIKAIDELHAFATEAAAVDSPADEDARQRAEDRRAKELAILVQKGAALIARLQQAEQALGFEAASTQWKIALEDLTARMSGSSQAIWAAARELHRGTLRTPYGVLVCTTACVNEVLANKCGRYSVSGYAERMRRSFGEIYLGMDDGPEYKHHSTKPNEAIEKIKIDEAFKAAREAARSVVSGLVGAPTASKPVDVEVKDIVDELLAKISKAWFGLPDGDHVLPGNWHWQPKGSKPTCPGHFHSPSRFMFQPNPGDIATDIGEQHGQALKKSVLGFVTYWRAQKSPQSSDLGTIGSALFNQIDDDGTLASTLIGVMMGFLPTVDGNLRSTLFEWINDGTLWDVQRAYMVNGIKHDTSALESAMREIFPELRRAMQLRPVPEVIWRTALERHVLGSVEVQRGDRIVVSLVSATQEQLLDDERDLFLVFGGDRSQKDHPTHACPGYKMAIGVLLGTLAGLMESAQLRPALSPMALQLSPLKS